MLNDSKWDGCYYKKGENYCLLAFFNDFSISIYISQHQSKVNPNIFAHFKTLYYTVIHNDLHKVFAQCSVYKALCEPKRVAKYHLGLDILIFGFKMCLNAKA